MKIVTVLDVSTPNAARSSCSAKIRTIQLSVLSALEGLVSGFKSLRGASVGAADWREFLGRSTTTGSSVSHAAECFYMSETIGAAMGLETWPSQVMRKNWVGGRR